MDKFRVEVIAKTPNPQQVIYAAMHQDYSENLVYDEREKWPNESKAGKLIVKHLLSGGRGHYGPLEHPQIILNCGYFPHSVMQQVRTHRVGISFDVQCLAANTEVTFVNCNGESSKKLRKTIRELYDLWHNGEKAIRSRQIRGRKGEPPGEYRRDCKKRLQKMRLRVLNEDTGLFEVGHIEQVICQGIQPVYRITLETGKTLDCTINHRLFTSGGWQTMGEAVGLVTGKDGHVINMTKDAAVMCNGIPVTGNRLYREKAGMEEKITAGFSTNYQTNSSGNTAQSAVMKYSVASSKPCTTTLFYSAKRYKLKAHPVKIVKVEYLGEQMTYDLEVAGNWHNFVANGLVVHNSNRYTGARIIQAAEDLRPIEEVFYLRPVGEYSNRQGKHYTYTEEQRQSDVEWCLQGAKRYQQMVESGISEEHARGIIPFDVRQHFVVSLNGRSLMHLLDLRYKLDAQLECQKLCEHIFPHFQSWMPEIAEWYEKNRLKKAKLSP